MMSMHPRHPSKKLRLLTIAVVAIIPCGLFSEVASAAPQNTLSCYNLDCPTTNDAPYYQGGPIITHPVVYLVRFSASQTALTPASGFIPNTFSPTQPDAAGAVDQFLSPSAAGWWMSAYSPSVALSIHPGALAGTITIYDPALATKARVTDPELTTELTVLDQKHRLPGNLRRDIFVVFFRANQDVIAPGLGNSVSTFCAYHSYDNTAPGPEVNYAVIPYEGANSGCDYGGVDNGGLDAFDAMTVDLSHEIAETVTDPSDQLAWSAKSGDEVADVCAASNFPAYQSALTSYYFQLLYAPGPAGCFGATVSTTLDYTPVPSGPLSVTLGMDVYGVASGQTIDLYANQQLVDTSITNAEAQATLDLPVEPVGTAVTITYPGSGPLDTSSSTYQVAPPATPQSTTPTLAATMEANSVGGYSPTINIATTNATSQTLTVSYGSTSTSTVLYSDGTANPTVTVPTGTTTYTISMTPTPDPTNQAPLSLTLTSRNR